MILEQQTLEVAHRRFEWKRGKEVLECGWQYGITAQCVAPTPSKMDVMETQDYMQSMLSFIQMPSKQSEISSGKVDWLKDGRA